MQGFWNPCDLDCLKLTKAEEPTWRTSSIAELMRRLTHEDCTALLGDNTFYTRWSRFCDDDDLQDLAIKIIVMKHFPAIPQKCYTTRLQHLAFGRIYPGSV